MIRYALLFLLTFPVTRSAGAQNVEGDWKGVLDVGSAQLTIEFHFKKDDAGIITGTWDSPDQGAFGLSFSAIRATGDSLIAEIEAINGSYSGRFNGNDSIAGSWSQGGIKWPLSFTRKQSMREEAVDKGQDVSIKMRDGIEIKGSTWFHKKTAPLVIIVAGSGPTDRDGNNPLGVRSNSYLMLAQSLDRAGISSYRYDKRGVAKSVVPNLKQEDLSFEDYANDVVNIISYFKDQGYKNIWIAGHSEGSLLGMIAAQRVPVSGFISISGAGFPAGNLLRKQLNAKMPSYKEATDKILASLEEGQKVADIPTGLANVFFSSIQPYLISWLKYDPAKEIEKLDCSVLILQGTCDQQVDTTNAKALAGANKKAELLIINQMTHVLKDGGVGCVDEMKTYTDVTAPLMPELVEKITGFIKGH
ncbi:MAG: alpha/beta fold hydrolase [Chitinophagaceae bacterium]|nr:alpha/beta fold hydrolase [Chitinophagaceae bacterium]